MGQQRGAVRAVKGGDPGAGRGSGTGSAEGRSTSSQRRQITKGGVELGQQRVTELIDQEGCHCQRPILVHEPVFFNSLCCCSSDGWV